MKGKNSRIIKRLILQGSSAVKEQQHLSKFTSGGGLCGHCSSACANSLSERGQIKCSLYRCVDATKLLWRAFQMFRINVLAEVVQKSSSVHAGCLLVNPPVQSKKRCLICPLFTVLCVRSLTRAISFQSAHRGAHVPIVSSA